MNKCPKCGRDFSKPYAATTICPACSDIGEIIKFRQQQKHKIAIRENDEYDHCYNTGNYTGQYCALCPHGFECSAYDDDD